MAARERVATSAADEAGEEEGRRMVGMDKELIRRLSSRDFAKGQRLAKERRWEAVQIKTFKAWLNFHLAPRGMQVNELENDIKSGVVLLNLLEALTGQRVGKRDLRHDLARELELPFSLANLRVGLDFIEHNIGLRLVNCSAEEIVKGNTKIILAVLWVLIRKFHVVDPALLRTATAAVSDSSELQVAAEKHLLAWARERSSGLVEIANFTTSWQNGLAFCALLHHYRPDLIDFHQLDAEEAKTNLELAFSVAEAHFSVARLLDADDLIAYPEEMSILIYALGASKKGVDPGKKLSMSTNSASLVGGHSASGLMASGGSGGVTLIKRKASKSFFFISTRERDTGLSGVSNERVDNNSAHTKEKESEKEKEKDAPKKQSPRVSFSPRNQRHTPNDNPLASHHGTTSGGGGDVSLTRSEGDLSVKARTRMWGQWHRARDEPTEPSDGGPHCRSPDQNPINDGSHVSNSNNLSSNRKGSASGGGCIVDSVTELASRVEGDKEHHRWNAATLRERLSNTRLGLGGRGPVSGSNATDGDLRRSKSGTFESRQREREREREKERERGAKDGVDSNTAKGGSPSRGRGPLRNLSFTNLRSKRRSASLVERTEQRDVRLTPRGDPASSADREREKATESLRERAKTMDEQKEKEKEKEMASTTATPVTITGGSTTSLARTSTWLSYSSPARLDNREREPKVVMTPRRGTGGGCASAASSKPGTSSAIDSLATSSSSHQLEVASELPDGDGSYSPQDSGIYDAFQALEKVYASLSLQDKNLSEALMVKLEETKKLLSSSSANAARSRSSSGTRDTAHGSRPRTSSRLRDRDVDPATLLKEDDGNDRGHQTEPDMTSARDVDATMTVVDDHVDRSAGGIKRDSVAVHTPALASGLSSVLPRRDGSPASTLPGPESSPPSSASSSLSSSPLSTSSTMTLGTLTAQPQAQALRLSHSDVLLQRSSHSFGGATSASSPSIPAMVTTATLHPSTDAEEEIDMTCLGAKIRGELTERGAEKLKKEIEAHRADDGGWYGTDSRTGGKRKRRERELAVIVTGDLNEKALASLAMVGETLKRLCIGDNEEITELDEVAAAVPEVIDLTLERCPHLSNLSPLTTLERLICLSLDDLPSVTDLSVLASLRSLEELNIRACCLSSSSSSPPSFSPSLSSPSSSFFATIASPFSLSFLSSLSSLRALRLSSADLDDRSSVDLQPLEDMTRLEVLSLRRSSVRSVEGLRRCKRLRVLDLHSSPLVSLAALSVLTSLERLCLAGTWCEDYSPLRHLRDLAHLNLNLSAFTQLEVIESLPHLRTLHLARCPIPATKWNSLSTARNLRELNVSHTSFADCAVLWLDVACVDTSSSTTTPTPSGRVERMASTTKVITQADDNVAATLQLTASNSEVEHHQAATVVGGRVALPRLERLDLDGCHVQENGMEGFKDLTNLKFLSLRQVPSVGDLSVLAGCGGLRYLYLEQDQVPPHLLHHLHSILPKLYIHVSS